MELDLTPKWSLAGEHLLNLGSALGATVNQLVKEHAPELAELFPFRHSWNLEAHFHDQWLALTITDKGGAAIPSVGSLDGKDLEEFSRQIALPFQPQSPEELWAKLGRKWFTFERFSYIGPWSKPCACWPHMNQHLVAWLNHIVIPEVERRNRLRVQRALPPSPQFNVDALRSSLWVLECEQSMKQGTAFDLAGVGTVTCSHTLGMETYAFRATNIDDRRRVRVIKRSDDLDLALIEVEGVDPSGLPCGTADGVKELDHLALTGFPNYNLGDTGIFVPALVVGFRMRTGIRHILTNGPIVAGMSGGPAVDRNHKVIGVAVTGADKLEGAQDTEKHGIIPIDALRHVGT